MTGRLKPNEAVNEVIQSWAGKSIGSLFAPLPDDKTDPTRQRKVQNWSRIITEALQGLHDVSFTLADLEQLFKHGALVPKCLAQVLEDMTRSGEIAPLNSFLPTTTQSTGGMKGWLYSNLVAKPASWAWSKLSKTDIQSTRFASARVIQVLADAMLDEHYKRTGQGACLIDHIVPMDELRTIPMDGPRSEYSEETLCALVGHLCSTQRAALVNAGSSGPGVKFAARQGAKVSNVTEGDCAVAQLRSTDRKLKQQVDRLRTKSEERMEQVRLALQAKNRTAAAAHLKHQKLLLSMYNKRAATLDSVQQILLKLEQAESDAEVLRAYKTGTQLMRQTTAQVSPEDAEEVLADLQDAFADQAEVDRVLTDSGSLAMSETEREELEEELAQLVAAGMPQLPQTPVPMPVAVGPAVAPSTATMQQAPSPTGGLSRALAQVTL
eukprot:TRINITY_DN15792_c0_g1_i1.p1 TRINITY_DN15792_c0_g1~~TRINITY_DN15792_c0_g1_i1.p1  ORF type:complete len:446 (-),score=97.09 TRINITY_DN15792_c0_g1_i1:220-1530(-)